MQVIHDVMLNHITKRSVPFIVTTVLVAMNLSLPALAKPVRIAEAVSFDLEACRRTSDGNDVVCTGTLLSRSGEKNISISRNAGGFNGGGTYITTSQGKTHIPSSILAGDRICNNNPDQFSFACNSLDITLVEGVKYKSSFIFRDVSSDSSKIALLSISFGYGYQSLKYRNLNIFQTR
jgi:hypothetical protein